MRRAALCVVVVVALLATACAPRRDVAEPAAPGDLQVGYYRDAIARGEPVFRIDGAASLVTVYVYRDGPLARLGHDHVVASRDVRGFAAAPTDPARARADLRMPVATLIVDAADLRAAAGFESEPAADDIAGTRENMLKSLDAEAFPAVELAATLAAPLPEPRLSVELRLHGIARSVRCAGRAVGRRGPPRGVGIVRGSAVGIRHRAVQRFRRCVESRRPLEHCVSTARSARERNPIADAR